MKYAIACGLLLGLFAGFMVVHSMTVLDDHNILITGLQARQIKQLQLKLQELEANS